MPRTKKLVWYIKKLFCLTTTLDDNKNPLSQWLLRIFFFLQSRSCLLQGTNSINLHNQININLNLLPQNELIFKYNSSNSASMWDTQILFILAGIWDGRYVRRPVYETTRGLCYKTDYGRNEWSYDRKICFCVIKHWIFRNYG